MAGRPMISSWKRPEIKIEYKNTNGYENKNNENNGDDYALWIKNQ